MPGFSEAGQIYYLGYVLIEWLVKVLIRLPASP